MRILIKGQRRDDNRALYACYHYELGCDCDLEQGCGCLGLCPKD